MLIVRLAVAFALLPAIVSPDTVLLVRRLSTGIPTPTHTWLFTGNSSTQSFSDEIASNDAQNGSTSGVDSEDCVPLDPGLDCVSGDYAQAATNPDISANVGLSACAVIEYDHATNRIGALMERGANDGQQWKLGSNIASVAIAGGMVKHNGGNQLQWEFGTRTQNIVYHVCISVPPSPTSSNVLTFLDGAEVTATFTTDSGTVNLASWGTETWFRANYNGGGATGGDVHLAHFWNGYQINEAEASEQCDKDDVIMDARSNTLTCT